MTAVPPEHVDVLVIGGGPAGSYAASCLARENIEVCIIEAEKFPRYHIGESMMAALRHFLRFIDLESGFENHGFRKKNGAAFKLNRENREGYTDFVSHDKGNYSWNLLRADADYLMLQHAGKSGAKVVEETKVTEVHFEGEGDAARPVSADWRSKTGQSGTIKFNWLIDASGRSGIVSTKNLKNRRFNQNLKNIATWGYWKGAGIYSPKTARAGAPWFEAITDQTGWAWAIPLHDGTTSVGIVMNQQVSVAKKKAMGAHTLKDFYLKELERAPDIQEMLKNATLVEKEDGTTVRSASDYSYSADTYAGNHFRLAGDAAAFIDPFFSSGVHLAISSGLSAAATICASLRGDCTEEEAHRWHSIKVGASYTRFLVVVLAAYRQMHAQEHPVLSDVDEKNFDRAFEHFRPIIQGYSDVSTSSYTDELKRTIDFCAQAFEPSEPEAEELAVGEDTFAAVSKVPEDTELTGLDKDSKRVLSDLKDRGAMDNSDFEHIDNLTSDKFEGYMLRLTRGSLGLMKF